MLPGTAEVPVDFAIAQLVQHPAEADRIGGVVADQLRDQRQRGLWVRQNVFEQFRVDPGCADGGDERADGQIQPLKMPHKHPAVHRRGDAPHRGQAQVYGLRRIHPAERNGLASDEKRKFSVESGGVTGFTQHRFRWGGSNSVVECKLPKLDVAGSSPVPRSIIFAGQAGVAWTRQSVLKKRSLPAPFRVKRLKRLKKLKRLKGCKGYK